MPTVIGVAVFLGVYGFALYSRYPNCQPGHIAVFAPQLNGGWACAQGYDPSPPRASK